MKTIVLLIASLLVAGNWVFADEEPSLDDPKVLEKILKDAVIVERLELLEAEEAELVYETGKRTPHTGWIKKVHINGRVAPSCEHQGREDGGDVINLARQRA